jgi:hypothetical protein
MNSKTTTAACNELIDSTSPQQWINFLFDLQNTLISTGYFADYTNKGAQEFGSKFSDLKHFFETLSTNTK